MCQPHDWSLSATTKRSTGQFNCIILTFLNCSLLLTLHYVQFLTRCTHTSMQSTMYLDIMQFIKLIRRVLYLWFREKKIGVQVQPLNTVDFRVVKRQRRIFRTLHSDQNRAGMSCPSFWRWVSQSALSWRVWFLCQSVQTDLSQTPGQGDFIWSPRAAIKWSQRHCGGGEEYSPMLCRGIVWQR